MIKLFSEQATAKAFAAKKRMLTTYLIFLGIYVIASVLIVVFQNRKIATLMIIINISISAVFWCGTLFFFSIKYKLTRRYVKMLKYFELGIKDTSTGIFLRYEDEITEKDGVFFYSMVIKQPSIKREDIDERKILIEKNISKPELNEGDKVKVMTHANILISYEVVSKAKIEDKADIIINSDSTTNTSSEEQK